jgi:hypothetical protein
MTVRLVGTSETSFLSAHWNCTSNSALSSHYKGFSLYFCPEISCANFTVTSHSIFSNDGGVLQCTDSVLQYTDSVLQCTDSVLQCTDSVLQCTDSVLQCTDSVSQCTDSVSQCTDIVSQSTDSVLQCTDSLSCQLLYNLAL